MKYPFLYISGIALLLVSCAAENTKETLHNTTVQGSLDFVNLHESGDSKLTYDSKTKENVIVFTDWYIADLPINSLMPQNSVPDEEPQSGKAAASSKISLRYGLEYIGKGAKFPGGNFNINLNYLAAPIDAIYHYPAGPGQVEGGLGPYFAYGVSGSSGGVSSFGENNGGFKRFDAGLDFQLGYKLDNGLSLRLGYDLGMANVEYPEEDVKGHTRAFSINIGYQIGRLFGKK